MTANPVEEINLSAAGWAALVRLHLKWRVTDRDGRLWLSGPGGEAELPVEVLDELEQARLVMIVGEGDRGRPVLTPRGSTAAVLVVRQRREQGLEPKRG